MRLPETFTVYEVTPTVGLAVGSPEFREAERTETGVSHRVTYQTWKVRRDTPEDPWEPVE